LDQTVGFHYGGVALSNNITAEKFLDEYTVISVPGSRKPATVIAISAGYGTW
jgi:hypothetical protein